MSAIRTENLKAKKFWRVQALNGIEPSTSLKAQCMRW